MTMYIIVQIKCIVQDKLAAKDCKTKSVYSKLLAMLRAPEKATVENFCASAINYAKEVGNILRYDDDHDYDDDENDGAGGEI